MIGEQLLSKKPLTLVDVKALLGKRKKDKELRYEQDLTLKYAKQFAKLTPAKASKALDELVKIEGITPDLAVKIVDLLPTEMELLKIIPGKEIKLKEETFKQVLEITEKYSKEKIEPEIEREEKKPAPAVTEEVSEEEKLLEKEKELAKEQ